MITFETIAYVCFSCDVTKSDIRGYAIKYSSEVKKQETEVIKDKERELNTLEALQESLNYTDQNIENKRMITFETIAYVCFSCDVTKFNRNQKGIKSTLYIGVFLSP
jgi:ribosomal protein L37AE/L43A